MPDSWLTAIACLLLGLVAVNAAIFLLAWYEWAASYRKDPWLRSTQVVLPPTGSVRSTAILLHGFGGTPRDFRSMAEALASQGFRVVVPALPGQTSTSFAYGRGRYTAAAYCDWLGCLIREERRLSGKPPALVGTSMGGTLAAIGAAEHDLSRLVLIAPYISLAVGGEWTTQLTNWIKWILPVMPKVQKGQISDPAGYKEYQTGSYLVSLPAFLQLAELARIARGKAQRPGAANAGVCRAEGRGGLVCHDRAAVSRERQGGMVVCDRSNHVLTYDYDRERITAETLAFLTAETSP